MIGVQEYGEKRFQVKMFGRNWMAGNLGCVNVEWNGFYTLNLQEMHKTWE